MSKASKTLEILISRQQLGPHLTSHFALSLRSLRLCGETIPDSLSQPQRIVDALHRLQADPDEFVQA